MLWPGQTDAVVEVNAVKINTKANRMIAWHDWCKVTDVQGKQKTSEVRAVELNKMVAVVQAPFHQSAFPFFLNYCLVNVNFTTSLFIFS